MTHAPSTYKIPTANDCPPVFNVRAVRQRGNVEDTHPPQQGGRRAAAAAAVLGVLRDPRCGVGGRRAPRRSAAACAGDERGDPARGRPRCRPASARDASTARVRDVADRLAGAKAGPRSWSRCADARLGAARAPARACWSAARETGRHDRRRPPRAEGDRARRARCCAGGTAAPQSSTSPLGPSLGQCCGGAVTLRFAPLDAAALDALAGRRAAASTCSCTAPATSAARSRALLATLDCRVDWIDEREEEFPATTRSARPGRHIRRGLRRHGRGRGDGARRPARSTSCSRTSTTSTCASPRRSCGAATSASSA